MGPFGNVDLEHVSTSRQQHKLFYHELASTGSRIIQICMHWKITSSIERNSQNDRPNITFLTQSIDYRGFPLSEKVHESLTLTGIEKNC